MNVIAETGLGVRVVLCSSRQGEEAWTQYVDSVENSVFFQHIGWKRLIESRYGLKSHYLMAVENSRVRGILPLFLLRSPFFGTVLASCPHFSYGGICADDEEAGASLVEAAIELSKQERVDYLELKNYPSPSRGDLANKDSYCTMVLELDPDPQRVWKGKLQAETRNQVRKAAKSGLIAELGLDEHIDDYCQVLSRNMRDLGSLMDSRSFVRAQFTEFRDEARIVVVKRDGVPVAAMDMFFFKDTVHVRYAGSIREFLSLCPNNLLWWTAIEYSCRQGYRFFDFGRSQWNSGTFRFKAQWGAEPKPLYYQYYLNRTRTVPEAHQANPRYSLAVDIWKRLPVSVAGALGSRLIKYVP